MTNPVKNPSHEAIAARAKEIWSAEGKPEGQELAHWYRAENELRHGDHSEADAGAEGGSGKSSAHTGEERTTPREPPQGVESPSRPSKPAFPRSPDAAKEVKSVRGG